MREAYGWGTRPGSNLNTTGSEGREATTAYIIADAHLIVLGSSEPFRMMTGAGRGETMS